VKLVDTSFLVDYAKGHDTAVSYLSTHDEEVGASTIVLSEVYRGLMVTQGMTREGAMSKYAWVTAVPFSNEIASEAASLYAELRERGGMINRSDIYIAATARSLGVPLLTADDDFDAVDNLTVETYR